MITGVAGTYWQPINHLSHWDNASANHFHVIYQFLFHSVFILIFWLFLFCTVFQTENVLYEIILENFIFFGDFRD